MLFITRREILSLKNENCKITKARIMLEGSTRNHIKNNHLHDDDGLSNNDEIRPDVNESICYIIVRPVNYLTPACIVAILFPGEIINDKR